MSQVDETITLLVIYKGRLDPDMDEKLETMVGVESGESGNLLGANPSRDLHFILDTEQQAVQAGERVARLPEVTDVIVNVEKSITIKG